MAELIDVFNAMTKNRGWSDISNDDKEKNFFIFNRYFAKKYPEKSQLLNTKNIDKVMAMELWYHFIQNEPYPKWFWSKGDKVEKSEISSKDFKSLLSLLMIKPDDLDYLIKNHFDFIKEELTFIHKLSKL